MRTVGGLAVRPTSDRLRETLFNIIAPRISRCRFLDICAGSGAVGIEALSRGASEVTFIEQSRRACGVIGSNLKTLGIVDGVTTVNRDATTALRQLESNSATFDIVFFDPPYASEVYTQVLNRLGSGDLLSTSGVLIVEHHAKTPPDPKQGRLRAFREVKQGESALTFYEVEPVSESG